MVSVFMCLPSCKGTRTSIAIEDEGPGIAQHEQAKVLRPYYRIETSRNRSTGGYGLGLSICDEVMRAHGGRVEFGHTQQRFCVRLVLPVGLAASS